MPLYEYKCINCGQVTSELRSMSEREEPLACPHCDGATEVILSTFATAKSTRSAGSNQCEYASPDCGST